MKKVFLTSLIIFLVSSSCYASQDRYSKEYLQGKRHISIINPIVEKVVESAIKKELKKETGADFKVSFTGYTTSSMKKGIFKSLELSGKNIIAEGIPLPYVHLKTLSDYNYIDYTKSPVEYKSDMIFAYNMILSEESINIALRDKKYQKVISKVNKIAYPLFVLTNVQSKIYNNELYLIMDYNFPIAGLSKDRTFVASSDLKVEKGKIKAKNVKIDNKYGNLGLDRVANLINLLNPLGFTLELMDSKKCDGNIENVNIVDNNIQVDGKIFVKGDKK